MSNGLQPTAVWYACVGAAIGATLAMFSIIQNHQAPGAVADSMKTDGDTVAPSRPALFASVPPPIAVIPVSTARSPDADTSTVSVRQGDTLLGLLKREGVDTAEAHLAVSSLAAAFDPRDINVGQAIQISLSGVAERAENALNALRIKVGPGHDVVVVRSQTGSFVSQSIKAETETETRAFTGTIKTSLYEAAVSQGVPAEVLVRMIQLFSYDVDFQRDIRKDDSFEILFDQLVTADGLVVRNDDVAFASMTLRGDTLKIYAFEHEDGVVDYYTEEGKGIRKALMRTPINGARLSSSFGRRKHPILGYTKMHRGVDFAAPHGTPIYAAGDGVIEKRGRWGSFGNYIRIRHGDGFSTAYAHMQGFARGQSVGKRVRQGAVIGYVGTTGRSTGPHLHYEVLRNGTQVNPMKVRFPASKVLTGDDLAAFQDVRQQLDRKWRLHIQATEVASAALPASDN